MNKTVTVTLNGVIFHIEEEAYVQLNDYLKSVEEYFQHSGDGAEIVQDMETSIADKFSEKMNGTKKVITKKDVEELIKIMGTINDFKSDVSTNSEKSNEQKKTENRDQVKSEKHEKKLYRDPDDVIIAGVCSGIAAFFNVEPVLIRLAFFVTIFFGGAGVLAYIVLWIIMPVAKTNTQKLEMQGAIVTLKKLEEIVKEKAEGIKKKAQEGEIKNVLALPFKFIGAIFKALGKIVGVFVPLVATIVGVVIIIVCVSAITGVGTVLGAMIFNLDSAFLNLEIPIKEIAGATQYHVGLFSGAFIVLIPLIFILTIGVALVRRKNIFNVIFNSVLVGVWMIAIITFALIAVDTEPKVQEALDEYEIAERTTREFDFKDFNNVYISGPHEANIVQGEEYKIVASGKSNDIDRLELIVKDEQLKIKSRKGKGICIFCNYKGVEFEITMPTLNKVALSGASKINASKFSSNDFEAILSGASQSILNINTNNFLADISGASKLEFTGSSSIIEVTTSGASNLRIANLRAEKLKIGMSGASEAELSGSIRFLQADLSGVSKIYAYQCSVDEASIDASGASRAELLVNNKINVAADGASKVYYKGEAVLDKKLDEDLTIDNTDEAVNTPIVEKAEEAEMIESIDNSSDNIIQVK